MAVVQFEMVELVDDLLACLASEELGMLDHGRVDFFEAELERDPAKEVE